MNINYNANAILEAEMIDGKETITVACENCGDVWKLEDSDIFLKSLEDGNVILKSWPYFECPHCGHWIPLF